MDTVLKQVEFLLLVAAIVAMVARRLRIPYIAGLVAAGIGLAFLRLPLDIPLTKELVFYTLLPPLIFEAAFYIPWKELKTDLPVISAFATVGLLLSAAVTALGMHYAAGWEWGPCLVFGALIAVPVAAALAVLVQNLYVDVMERAHAPTERDALKFKDAPLPRARW